MDALKDKILSSSNNDWQNCAGYLLTGEHFNTILAKIKSLTEKSDLKDEMLKNHLDKQDTLIEQQVQMTAKMFNRLDSNKKDTDEKIEKMSTENNKLILKVAFGIISVLLTVIGFTIYNMPFILEWLKMLIK